MTTIPASEKIPALPAWRVIWDMLRFRPWLWFIDLLSVALIRFCWQLAPALIIKAFFDMLTGAAQLTFGVWAIFAFLVAPGSGACPCQLRLLLRRCADFCRDELPAAQEPAAPHPAPPGASPLPDSAGEAVSRFRNDVNEIPLFVIWINDIIVGVVIILVAIGLMVSISVPITLMAWFRW
jgi:ATP-binding cassette, subfamily B, bacterial